MDNLKVLREFRLSFVKNTADSEEHGLLSGCDLPALTTRFSMSEPCCFCGESSHCSEDGWCADWDLYSFCVCESVDYLRYNQRLNCDMKKSTEMLPY